MSASLTDILTAAKNLVTAVNQLGQTYLGVQGINHSAPLTAATVVQAGGGRLANIVVVVAGSAPGAAYDCSSTSALSNQVATIPNTLGSAVYNVPLTAGLTIVPGTGQTVVVTYS